MRIKHNRHLQRLAQSSPHHSCIRSVSFPTPLAWLRLTQWQLVRGGDKYILCYKNTMGEMAHLFNQKDSECGSPSSPRSYSTSITQNLREMLNFSPTPDLLNQTFWGGA